MEGSGGRDEDEECLRFRDGVVVVWVVDSSSFSEEDEG